MIGPKHDMAVVATQGHAREHLGYGLLPLQVEVSAPESRSGNGRDLEAQVSFCTILKMIEFSGPLPLQVE